MSFVKYFGSFLFVGNINFNSLLGYQVRRLQSRKKTLIMKIYRNPLDFELSLNQLETGLLVLTPEHGPFRS